MSDREQQSPARGGAEAAVLGLLLIALLAVAGSLRSWTAQLGALQAISFAAFAVLAVALVRMPRWRPRHGGALVVAVALLMRLAVFAREPELSDDVYRYVWDGRVIAAGFDPYAHAPADTALAALRDAAVRGRINHPQLRTIYPPLAEAGFAVANAVWPGVHGMKAWILLHDLALWAVLAAWCARRNGSPMAAIAYAWNPLFVIEYAGSAHHDPTALLPLALAFALAGKRPAWSALAFSVAVLGKLAPLLVLPFLWRVWPARARALAVGASAAGLALFAWRASGGASGLQAYASHWRNNELVFHYVAAALGDPAARVAVAAGVVAFTLFIAARARDAALGARTALRALLVTGPVLHPWYLGWAMIFEPLAPSWPWLLLSALALLNYGVGGAPFEGGGFHLPLAWRWLEYGLPLALAAVLRFRSRSFRSPPDA